MTDTFIERREIFLENIVKGLTEDQTQEVLKIFLESSREFRRNNQYPSDMTGKEYVRMLAKEFSYQKDKILHYIKQSGD